MSEKKKIVKERKEREKKERKEGERREDFTTFAYFWKSRVHRTVSGEAETSQRALLCTILSQVVFVWYKQSGQVYEVRF